MCKDQSASVGPSWTIERRASLWRVKVVVSKAPEVDISPSALRLKLTANLEALTLPIPEQAALSLDPEVARCSFSKRRGELVVEWPCGADEVLPNEVSKAEALTLVQEGVEPENAQGDEHSTGSSVTGAVLGEPAAAESVQMLDEAAVAESKTDDSTASTSLEFEETTAPAEVVDSSCQEFSNVDADAVQQPMEERKEPESSVTADEWRARGNDAVKSGDLGAAIECYSSGIIKATKAGGDAEAEALLCSNRALCFHKVGRYQECVDDAMRCITLKPSFVKGYLRGAMALRALARPAQALALLKRAPRNDEAGSLAAEIRPEAEAAERAHIEALPKDERAKEEGNVLFRKGLFEAAAEKYSEALGLCQEPTGTLALSIRNNRAACYHQISDFHAVIKDTNFVLEHEPKNVKALVRRMLALEPLERYEQALQDARAVLSQDPRHQVANKMQHRLGKLVRDLSRANSGA